MYIVGIDIGKNHHEASIVSPEGKQIGRSLRFATTRKGADSLMKIGRALSSKTSVIPLVYLAWKLQVITGIPFIHF